MSKGWDPSSGEFPWPPMNATAMSAFHSSDADIRWDDPSIMNTGPRSPTERASVELEVVSTPAAWVRASGSFEVKGVPNPADYIEISGIILTAISGAAAKDEFDVSSGNVVTIAQNIKSAINSGSLNTLEILLQ